MVSTIVPSQSNVYGKLAATVAGIATAFIASKGYDASITSAIGLDPSNPQNLLQVTGALTTIVTALVAFLFAHFAELRRLGEVLASLPKVYAKPEDFPSEATKNNPFTQPPASPAVEAVGQKLEISDVVAVVKDNRDFPQGKNGA